MKKKPSTERIQIWVRNFVRASLARFLDLELQQKKTDLSTQKKKILALNLRAKQMGMDQPGMTIIGFSNLAKLSIQLLTKWQEHSRFTVASCSIFTLHIFH